MNPKIIVIDGKTYNSVEEMPPDVRQKYEAAMSALQDQNKNGIPDVLEGNLLADKDGNGKLDILENNQGATIVSTTLKVLVDGKEYNKLEDLPPEVRAKYEQAMGALDANQNGIPDFLEGTGNTPKQTVKFSTNFKIQTPQPSSFSPAPAPNTNIGSVQDKPTPVPTAITPDTSNGLMLALAGLFIFLLCIAGAGAVWYFFLR
jgi:hypothetical protein